MASVGSPSETREYILERLIGDTGEPDLVTRAARAAAERAIGPLMQGFADSLGVSLDIELNRIDLVRLAAATPQQGNSAVVIAPSKSSPDALTIVLDSAAIALIVSTLFGADPDMPIVPIERDLSPLELELAANAIAELAKAMNGQGDRSLELKFPLPSAISGVELRKLVVRDAPAVQVVFSLSTPAGSGELRAIVPQRFLMKHRAEGGAGAASENESWGARFGEEVMRSNVELVATMAVGQMTLGEISLLQPGQVIAFEDNATGNVRLASRGKMLFTCEFGKVGQNYTVRVRQPYDGESEPLDHSSLR